LAAAWIAGVALLAASCAGGPASRIVSSSVAPAPLRTLPQVPTSSVRDLFLQALQQARQAAPSPDAELHDPAALRAYVLYDYLIAARLQHALQVAPGPQLDARIDAFVRAHPREPVVHDLHHDWLVSLAARGRWDWFLARASGVSDPLLLCQRLAGQLAVGAVAGAAAAPWEAEALALWSQPLQQASVCDGVFERLQQRGLLTPERVAARVRAALAAGNVALALQLAAALPPQQSAPLLQWARLLQSPAATLHALAVQPLTPVEPLALQAGFHRLALRDSAAAAALLPALSARPDMTALLRAELQREASLGLAYDHDAAALALFRTLPEPLADERVQQWRVRAALWSADWPQALTWLSAMPPALAMQPRWQYWRARASEQVLGGASAAPLYAALADSRDYYGYLAADRLHRSYDLQNQPSVDDTALQAALARRPELQRARELFICGLYDAAVAEWAAALASSTPAVKVQAARLAASWGWYTQSIATLATAGEWDDVRLRYPRPYTSQVAAAGELVRLPPDWILAVMRQESLFRSDAVSRANARGLMQLLPSTAHQVAQRWQLPLDTAGLFDPATAVTLGAAHLRELLDRFQNQLALALAAYNAGSVSLSRWLPSAPMAADVWIENIPYDETRGYVQHILEHIVAYAFTRDAEPPQLATLLPPVQMTSAVSAANSAPARR
jgi:soluble lytic murein transglycosylase